MDTIYIYTFGQHICIKVDNGARILRSSIEKVLCRTFIKNPDALDGVLRFATLDDYNNSLKDEIKDYPGKKYFLNNRLILWKDPEKEVTNGLYLIDSKKIRDDTELQVQHMIRKTIVWFCMNIFNHNGSLFFHASSIKRNKKGYLFSGKSGSGKTTICEISKDITAIHDEMSAVRRNHEGYFLFQPLDEEEREVVGPQKLDAVFFIRQSKVNRLKRLSLKKSLKESLPHCANLSCGTNVIDVYNNLLDLFKNVPVYNMYFKKDPSFWRLIDRKT